MAFGLYSLSLSLSLKYDETNVAERHLTSLYVHNFDKDNAQEIQMRAIEKVEKKARPDCLRNTRSELATAEEMLWQGESKVLVGGGAKKRLLGKFNKTKD